MKLTNYVIYRKGSNGRNQPGEFGWVPVTIVTASNREAAIRKAQEEEGVTCYNNQVLSAVPESRVSERDWNAAGESAGLAVLEEV